MIVFPSGVLFSVCLLFLLRSLRWLCCFIGPSIRRQKLHYRNRRSRKNGVTILSVFNSGVMNGSRILILHFDLPLLPHPLLPPSLFILQLERSINSYLRLCHHLKRRKLQQCYLIFSQLSRHFISGGMVVLRCSFASTFLPSNPPPVPASNFLLIRRWARNKKGLDWHFVMHPTLGVCVCVQWRMHVWLEPTGSHKSMFAGRILATLWLKWINVFSQLFLPERRQRRRQTSSCAYPVCVTVRVCEYITHWETMQADRCCFFVSEKLSCRVKQEGINNRAVIQEHEQMIIPLKTSVCICALVCVYSQARSNHVLG